MNMPSAIHEEKIQLSRNSILSLGLSILGMFCVGPIAAIPAIILGHISLSSIRRAGGKLRGRNCAIAGLFIGYASLILHAMVLFVVLSLHLSEQLANRLKCLTNPPNHLFDITIQDSSCRSDDIASILSHRLSNAGIPHKIAVKSPNTLEVRFAASREMPADSVRDLLVLPGNLEFCLVHTNNVELVSKYKSFPEEERANFAPPDGYRIMTMIEARQGKKPQTLVYFIKTKPEMTGRSIAYAGISVDSYGESFIHLSFDKEGAKEFGRVTKENINRQLGIVLDGTLYSAPNIQAPIEGGQAQITGQFSKKEAENISNALNGKSLPCPVSATQGRQLER